MAQSYDESLQAPISKAEWNRLRAVTLALVTEEGTKKLFRETPSLGEAFYSETVFLEQIAKWRPKISALPERWTAMANAEVNPHESQDGTLSYFVTYHHGDAINSITILRTNWRDNTLTTLSFMKGLANVPYDKATKNRDYNGYDTYERNLRQYYQYQTPRR